MLGRFAGWIDGQLGLARLGHQDFLRKIFPDHWSFNLGEVALYALVVLVGSGTTWCCSFIRAPPLSSMTVLTHPCRASACPMRMRRR